MSVVSEGGRDWVMDFYGFANEDSGWDPMEWPANHFLGRVPRDGPIRPKWSIVEHCVRILRGTGTCRSLQVEHLYSNGFEWTVSPTRD